MSTPEPVLVTRDDRSCAFLGAEGEGAPGTGGLFVPEAYGIPLSLMLAQVLVEYAEQGFSTVIFDDGGREMGEILYHVAHMIGLRNPEDIVKQRSIPLTTLDAGQQEIDVLRGIDVGILNFAGGFSVAIGPHFAEHDEHVCDMGDFTETLMIMAYQNQGFRVLNVREHAIEIGPNGRLVNKI